MSPFFHSHSTPPQDDFTVYERNRWTAARRHIFLLDQRLILTKEKDTVGLYVYKDSISLKVERFQS